MDQCTCGAVHVTVAGTTVRMEAATARELRDVMVRALHELDRGLKLVQAPRPDAPLVRDDDDDPTLH